MTEQSNLGSLSKTFTTTVVTAGLTAAMILLPTKPAIAEEPVKIGILLPYSGTYAMLGESITNGFKLRIEEAGGKIAGHDVEYVAIDSEMSVPKAPENTNKLTTKENVDFLVGPVHSGIAAAMAKIVGKKGTPIMIVPNAGSNAVTGELCAPNIFRTSFSNWQAAVKGGDVMLQDGHKKIVTISWKYGAGIQMMAAAREAFEAGGGESIKDILMPFPDVEFQAHLSEIAALKPDAVFAFFSGGGAVKFVKEYAAAGLKDSIPLYGPGFLTEGVSAAQGEAAEGIKTTLHYSADLDLEANKKFRETYRAKYERETNVFAVQGYDTASLILQAMDAVGGDKTNQEGLIKAMEEATIDSPRGAFTFSKAHNPVQNIYLRKVVGGKQQLMETIAEGLTDPATGCSL